MRRIVDLPAPFGPSSAVTPGPTVNETSETATTSPNHFDTSSTTIIVSGGARPEVARELRRARHFTTSRRW